MIHKDRKDQRKKLEKRELKILHHLHKAKKKDHKLLDAADNANLTDAIQSFDFKLRYDFED